MAAEPQTPDPEKQKKTRSFGSFLLFTFVLIVVLAYFGTSSITGPKELSQDQFLWELHNGHIVRQEFRGTETGSNDIHGAYLVDGPDGEPVEKRFTTSFADVERHEGLFRELNAIHAKPLGFADLNAGLSEGLYRPVEARSLISQKRAESQRRSRSNGDDEGRDDTGSQQATRRIEDDPAIVERLYVKVIASSQQSWEASSGQTYIDEISPPYTLPPVAQHMWFDVSMGSGDDLALMLAELEVAGAKVESHSFDLTEHAGSVFSDSNSVLATVLLVYGPWILIFAVFLIVMRQMRSQGGAGGVMSFGRSRAQLYSKENRTNVTFDDVAGASEAKAEVREIVEFLKNPGRFTRIGGRIPRGVLLDGPPGCGKTLLAKAIAGEAEVPFFSISGSDFVEMFVGVGASRVRDLFKQARENSPCIIFLDEIDAVGRRRGSGMGGGHDEREQTLNAILVEMDGFGTDEGIIVVAATNRPDVLDPALLRPGRFDREVTIDLPDLEGRTAILAVHLKRVKASEEIEVAVLARSTPGYSGADLAAIVNEAAIMAVLAKRDEIVMEDLEESRDKVRYGRQKQAHNIEEEDRRITAYHEAGHAVVAAVTDETDPPHKVTIVPRGRSLGSTMVLPEKESYHTQKKRLVGQLTMLFGGRVAEQEFCGDISAGASDDIKRATELARAMVTELGMSERIGPVNYADRQGSDFLGTELMRGKAHSEETAREIDEEVRKLLEGAYESAEAVMRTHHVGMEAIVEGLMRFETLSGAEVEQLLAGASLETLRPPPPEPEPPAPEPRVESPSPTPEPPSTGELPGEPGLSPA